MEIDTDDTSRTKPDHNKKENIENENSEFKGRDKNNTPQTPREGSSGDEKASKV